MRERKAAVCKQGHVGKCCMELNEKYTGDLKNPKSRMEMQLIPWHGLHQNMSRLQAV